MNLDAITHTAIEVLLILAVMVIIYVLWRFVARPHLERRKKWPEDIDPPRYVQQTQYGSERTDASLRQLVEVYSAHREEIARHAESSRRSEDEVRRMMLDLQGKHERWATDFQAYMGYKESMDLLLDLNSKNFKEELDRLRMEQSDRCKQIEARIEPLFEKQTCPWVETMQVNLELSDRDCAFLEAIVAYMEGIGPDIPKYLSGIEAATSQLGHFVFRELNQCTLDSRPELLAEICGWFSNLHQGHELKVPVVGDGFDERFHKDVSSSPRDKEAVSIVDRVVNWGLLEVGTAPRTVFKAEVECRD